MSLKDLRGKTVYDLEPEDFMKLFCWRCRNSPDCPKDDRKMLSCKVVLDSGLWDKFYRKK